jgi:peptidoglycan/xylan/chitin deacetylase (PgdA/CDA1 family)
MRALAFAFAVLFSAATAHAACPSEPAIGLSRIVEIDTRTGPLYGAHTGYQRSESFLQPKEVVLTFDDGPMPWITKSILDTLDRNCTKATFFSVGRMAIAYPATTREVLARGHSVGTHTWSHPLNLKRLKPESATDEIERGFAAVSLAAGQPIAPFFRFPGLNDNAALLTHLQSRGVATFTVDAISNDSYIHDEKRLIAHTLAQVESRQGGIILFHDIKAATARALPVILRELHARGYTVVHMRPAGTIEPLPQYAEQLAPMLAKALSAGKSPGKGQLVPFYGAMPQPDAVAAADDVPVTAIAPEAKVFQARASETASGNGGPKRPLVRTASGGARSAGGSRAARAGSTETGGGWFGGYSSGWVTTVAPPARLRRGTVD